MLTQDELKKVLNYDPETGIFTWKAGGRRHKGGSIAGRIDRGYVVIDLNYKAHRAHRLAWLYVHGKWPDEVIDHINGVRNDNRIANLRDVTNAVNCQGFRSISPRNKTGYTGVSWNERLQGFTAARMVNGKSKFLGVFNTAEEAANAYAKADQLPSANPRQYRARRPGVQWSYIKIDENCPSRNLTHGNFRARLPRMETDDTTGNARLLNARVRVQPYLERLKRREITNRAVADELNLTEEHVCRVLAELEFEKDPPVDRAAMKAATAAKKKRIAELAANHPPEEAARLAGVSLRTIYRALERARAKEPA